MRARAARSGEGGFREGCQSQIVICMSYLGQWARDQGEPFSGDAHASRRAASLSYYLVYI